jgi:hypothetical protein
VRSDRHGVRACILEAGQWCGAHVSLHVLQVKLELESGNGNAGTSTAFAQIMRFCSTCSGGMQSTLPEGCRADTVPAMYCAFRTSAAFASNFCSTCNGRIDPRMSLLTVRAVARAPATVCVLQLAPQVHHVRGYVCLHAARALSNKVAEGTCVWWAALRTLWVSILHLLPASLRSGATG